MDAELIALIFIIVLKSYAVELTAPQVYKVTRLQVRAWVLKYKIYSEEFLSDTFYRDPEDIHKQFETITLKVRNLLPEFLLYGVNNMTDEEDDLHLHRLTICFAQMLATDPEGYGENKPFNDVCMKKFREIIDNMLAVPAGKKEASNGREAKSWLSVDEAYSKFYPEFYDFMNEYSKFGLKKNADVFLRSFVVTVLTGSYTFCRGLAAANQNSGLAYLEENMRIEVADMFLPHFNQQSGNKYVMATISEYKAAIEADFNLIKAKLSGRKYYSTLEHDREIWNSSWLAFQEAILEPKNSASDDTLLKDQDTLFYESFRKLMDGTMICFGPATVLLK